MSTASLVFANNAKFPKIIASELLCDLSDTYYEGINVASVYQLPVSTAIISIFVAMVFGPLLIFLLSFIISKIVHKLSSAMINVALYSLLCIVDLERVQKRAYKHSKRHEHMYYAGSVAMQFWRKKNILQSACSWIWCIVTLMITLIVVFSYFQISASTVTEQINKVPMSMTRHEVLSNLDSAVWYSSCCQFL